MPLTGLLSEDYAATRRALITATAAPGPSRPGTRIRSTRAGDGDRVAVETTTHLTTSDRWGNVVSYTFTIESTGGAGLVVPGYGFLLNNELTDFNFDSTTHPNRVEGGKRPRSSMAPTIVPRERQAVPRARLAGRLDDHHDRAPDARRPARPRHDAAAGDRRPAREPAERRQHRARSLRSWRARSARRSRRAATTSSTPAKLAPRPGSSSSRAAACSPPPSRSAAAAEAR